MLPLLPRGSAAECCAAGAALVWLWNQFEGCGVDRTYDREVAPVERGDPGGPEALGDRDQAGVGATESKIGVGLDQFGDSSSVYGCDRFDLELTCGYGAEETRFRICTDLSSDQVRGLGDDEGGRYERT